MLPPYQTSIILHARRMFPILPILILLLLGPANAERLAVEGRLPAVLLAFHRTMAPPVRAVVVAPVETEPSAPPLRKRSPRPQKTASILQTRTGYGCLGVYAGWPTRAGPSVA